MKHIHIAYVNSIIKSCNAFIKTQLGHISVSIMWSHWLLMQLLMQSFLPHSISDMTEDMPCDGGLSLPHRDSQEDLRDNMLQGTQV